MMETYNELIQKYNKKKKQLISLDRKIKQLEKKCIRKYCNNYLPELSEPTHQRVINESCLSICKLCGSSDPRKGFLGLFGKRKCLNEFCKSHENNQ